MTATATAPRANAGKKRPANQQVTIAAGRLLNLLADASLFTSCDKARPVLCNVKLVLDGSTLTAYATDSYALVERSVEVEGDGAWIRYLDPADRRLLTAILRANDMLTATVETSGDWCIKVRAGTTTTEVGTRVDHYPDFDRLWAGLLTANTAPTAAFTARILARIGRLSGIGKKQPKPVVFTFYGERRPAAWALDGYEGAARGLIMPVRQP